MTQAFTATSEAERLRRLAMNAECIPCEDEGFADWSKRRRIVAISQRFVVSAPVAPPADFAEAVAEVDARQVPDVRMSDATLRKIEEENIGEEIGRRPFEW